MHPVLIWSSQLSLSQGSLTICPGLKKGSLTTDYKKYIVLSVFAFMIIGDSQWVMFILLILVLLFQWKGPAPVACYLLLLQRTLAWNRFEHTDGCIYCLFVFFCFFLLCCHLFVFCFVFSYCVARRENGPPTDVWWCPLVWKKIYQIPFFSLICLTKYCFGKDREIYFS